MVERKTPAAKTEEPKAPIGRFYELQKEVTPPEPYVLTEEITIYPLTRKRNIDLFASESDEQFLQALLGEQCDAVIALYDDLPVEHWVSFMTEIKRHLLGPGVDEAPGKSEESSDS